MPDTPKTPADDEARRRSFDDWWNSKPPEWNSKVSFDAGWRASLAEVRSRSDGVVAGVTKETHGPIQRDGLYCVYGKCPGFPNGQFECHPGCSFTMSTKAPWDHSREGF